MSLSSFTYPRPVESEQSAFMDWILGSVCNSPKVRKYCKLLKKTCKIQLLKNCDYNYDEDTHPVRLMYYYYY